MQAPGLVRERGEIDTVCDVDQRALLVFDQAQQQIHIDQFLKANRRILDECAPRMTSQSFHEYFDNWLAGNPGFLSRSAQLAFTASIFDHCEEQE